MTGPRAWGWCRPRSHSHQQQDHREDASGGIAGQVDNFAETDRREGDDGHVDRVDDAVGPARDQLEADDAGRHHRHQCHHGGDDAAAEPFEFAELLAPRYRAGTGESLDAHSSAMNGYR